MKLKITHTLKSFPFEGKVWSLQKGRIWDVPDYLAESLLKHNFAEKVEK